MLHRIFSFFFIILLWSCSGREETEVIPEELPEQEPEEEPVQKESSRFLKTRQVTFSQAADSVIVKTEGDLFFFIYYVWDIQGSDTIRSELRPEYPDMLQVIRGEWYEIRTEVLDSKAVFPAFISISVLPNTTGLERKLQIGATKANYSNTLIVIQRKE